jgi:hypothetical protein
MTTQDMGMSARDTHDIDVSGVEASGIEASGIEAWRYANKAMTWYGWGSPVGVGLFIISIGAFLVLIHHAGVL